MLNQSPANAQIAGGQLPGAAANSQFRPSGVTRRSSRQAVVRAIAPTSLCADSGDLDGSERTGDVEAVFRLALLSPEDFLRKKVDATRSQRWSCPRRSSMCSRMQHLNQL